MFSLIVKHIIWGKCSNIRPCRYDRRIFAANILNANMPVAGFRLRLENLTADKHICHAENSCYQKYSQSNTDDRHSVLLFMHLCGYGNEIKITLHPISLPNP